MNIGYFLKEPNQTAETMVYVTASINGKRLKRSTGVKVKPSQWTGTKVKPLAPDSETKNIKIENVVNILKDIEREYLLKQLPLSKDIIQKVFDSKIKPTETEQEKSIIDIFNEFIESKKPFVVENTIKTYRTCKKHLEEFSNEMGFDISFETMDLNFYDEFIAYFYSNDYLNSSIGKFVKVLKTFLNWAFERNYHTNVDFRKFHTFKEDSEKIKLTPDIVEKLRTTDFDNEYSNIVRDIFILSCYTGLRFIDIQNLRNNDISDDFNFIKPYIRKTKEFIEIPLLEVPKQIIINHLEKYKHLKVPTNQFCNREIKKLFKEIGFKDVVRFAKKSGSNNIVTEKMACDYLTMHYGRVFFITNSLINGMNEEFIRKITGHKDYKSFKKYVQFSSEMVSNSLKSAWG